MATWLFEFDLGAGFVDKTSLVIQETLDRRMDVHKDLKPTTNEVNFQVGPDASFVNALMAGGADVPMRITKDGTRWFTGYVQRIPETSLKANLQNMSLKAYDPSILLKRKLTADYKKWGSTVQVIVGELLTLAGVTSQNLGTISKAIDAAAFSAGSTTYFEAIEKILSDFGYVLWFDETGTARTFLLYPSSAVSTKTYNTGNTGNILDELKVSRKGNRYGGARVSFFRHESRSNLVVFSDPTNAGTLTKCNIDLTAYANGYPDRAGSEDVYCEYAVVENQVKRELIATNAVTFDIQGSGITVAQAVDYGLRVAVKVTGSGMITRLDVVAGSAILKGAKVIKESIISGISEDLEDYQAEYITADADADFLISGRRAYWENSGVLFSFKTEDTVALGAVVTIVDSTSLGYNLAALIVGWTEDDLGFKRVWCEALVPYAAQAVVTTGQAVQAPNQPLYLGLLYPPASKIYAHYSYDEQPIAPVNGADVREVSGNGRNVLSAGGAVVINGGDGATTYTAGTLVVGDWYRIQTVGTTDFTSIGASANSVGAVFQATGVGSGTGTVKKAWINKQVRSGMGVKTGGGTGTSDRAYVSLGARTDYPDPDGQFFIAHWFEVPADYDATTPQQGIIGHNNNTTSGLTGVDTTGQGWQVSMNTDRTLSFRHGKPGTAPNIEVSAPVSVGLHQVIFDYRSDGPEWWLDGKLITKEDPSKFYGDIIGSLSGLTALSTNARVGYWVRTGGTSRHFRGYHDETVIGTGTLADAEKLGLYHLISAPIADATPPTVPTGLTVVQLSSGALRIAFNASTDNESGVAIYRVYRRETSTTNESVIADVNAAGTGPFTVDDTSPIVGKYYQFAVSAVDGSGNESAKTSWSSSLISIISDAPATATGLSAAAVVGTVAVKWAAQTDAIAYQLEKSTDSGSSWLATGGWPLTVGANNYDEPIPAGTDSSALSTWRYRVKAISKDGVLSSAYSSVASVSVATAWVYTPSAPTLGGCIAKRSATLTIAKQANLADPDGWDVQISRDGTTWYAPNLQASSDADGWYTGAVNGVLTVFDTVVNIDFLPIPLVSGLPTAAGQVYYLRARARGKSAGGGVFATAVGPLTAYPGLYADLAAAQIKAASILDGEIVTAKLAVGAVTAGKIGVTNLDVDGGANIVRLNAELVYSAATAQVSTAQGAILLGSGPSAGKYAYNYFDLTAGKFRVGDANNYVYYDGAGGLELRLTTFKVSSLATNVLGTLSVSSTGTVDTLTNVIALTSDATRGRITHATRLVLNSPSAASTVYIGDDATGKTQLILSTSADTNGYAALQAQKVAGTTVGDLVLQLSGGNVGIGITNPIRALHIGASGGTEMILEQTDGKPDWRKWNWFVHEGNGTTAVNLSLRLLNDAGTAGTISALKFIGATGSTMVLSTEDSTSTITGALRVGGGLGVEKSLVVGGEISIANPAGGVGALIPAGSVVMWTMASIPAGWLDCNGQAVSRTTYSKLFTAIGTTYGAGNGTTTFNVPDLRSAAVRGVGTPTRFTDATAVTLNQTINDAIKAHTHSYDDDKNNVDSSFDWAPWSSGGGGLGDTSNSKTTGSTGGAETTGKAVGLYFIIKA